MHYANPCIFVLHLVIYLQTSQKYLNYLCYDHNIYSVENCSMQHDKSIDIEIPYIAMTKKVERKKAHIYDGSSYLFFVCLL